MIVEKSKFINMVVPLWKKTILGVLLEAPLFEIVWFRMVGRPRDQTQVFHTAGRRFAVWATRENYNQKLFL